MSDVSASVTQVEEKVSESDGRNVPGHEGETEATNSRDLDDRVPQLVPGVAIHVD